MTAREEADTSKDEIACTFFAGVHESKCCAPLLCVVWEMIFYGVPVDPRMLGGHRQAIHVMLIQEMRQQSPVQVPGAPMLDHKVIPLLVGKHVLDLMATLPSTRERKFCIFQPTRCRNLCFYVFPLSVALDGAPEAGFLFFMKCLSVHAQLGRRRG